ncbi:MAG: threonine synthase [Clostridia bacterium]|nr:threonine synthase [Clostridia bacterium]
MKYLSTRGGEAVSAAQAIEMGISPDGGLFVPEEYPRLDVESVIKRGFYEGIAFDVMKPYLPEFQPGRIMNMITEAYKSFDHRGITPLVPISRNESVMELWHGPTMAFKDVALQMLPRLLTESVKINGDNKTIYILVATSGDTGKAALEGFHDVPGTQVLVFYPHGGVSKMQRLQMVSQEGDNVSVCAVEGNFDDAQTGVKKIFADKEMAYALNKKGMRLSSANSINFGRLLPQIAYYFSAYGQLVDSGKLKYGQLVNFCVPTGNFGDILAGYYAKKMGLPVNRLILAANRNNVLTDFFKTGVYDASRPFYKSMSCSIDILISSNLERLLFDLADRDPELVKSWMKELSTTGKYNIGLSRISRVSDLFWSDWCSEEDTLKTISRVYDEYHYLMDPHTAVAQTAYERYAKQTGDQTQTVLLSTANPYKFATDVLSAFETPGKDDFKNVERLNALTSAPVPAPIGELMGKPERHTGVCQLNQMKERVLNAFEK